MSDEQPPPPEPPPLRPNARRYTPGDYHKKKGLSSDQKWLIGLGIVAVLVIGGALTRGDNNGGGSSIPPAADAGPTVVVYRVEGPALGDITYQNQNQDTSQNIGAGLPWVSSQLMQPGDFLYVSAQNSAAYGTMTCVIEVGGVVVEQNQSTGAYAICTASGTL